MSIQTLMIHRCTIERKTNTVAPDGGIRETWAEHRTEVPCRVQPRGQSESFNQGFDFNGTATVIYFHPVVGIRPSDRVVHEGITYVGRGSTETNRVGLFEKFECEALS